jgi:hypothetical protein
MGQAIHQISDESVRATLKFISPQATKPYFESAALAGGEGRFHFDVEGHEVVVQDLRAAALAPSLSQNGFEHIPHTTSVSNLYDDDAVSATYIPEIESVVAQALGATRVVAFDVTRRSDASDGANNRDGKRKPAGRIHVDYTVASGPKRAGDVLGRNFVDSHLASGGAIVPVNVWRPIKGPVLRSPLAVADAASIGQASLIPTKQVFPDRIGEIYHLRHAPAQRWFYVPRMMPDEILLLKGWDSRSEVASFAPHSAFSLPDEPAAATRESTEVRTFAVIGGTR